MKALTISNPPPTTRAQIQANIDARQDAELLILGLEKPPRFWEVLKSLAEEKLGIAIQARDNAMSDAEAFKFENELMRYGKFKDDPVGEVDTEYLAWLADGDQFIQQLRRYVRSKAFKDRQRDES